MNKCKECGKPLTVYDMMYILYESLTYPYIKYQYCLDHYPTND